MAYSVSDQVQQLYVGYLGRAADQDGLNFWVNAIEGKIPNVTATIESVALGFTLSPEYQAQYANLQPEQEVARVYQNVLGRTPDADGLKFWADALKAGTASADTLVSQMTANMGSIDTLNFQNKVSAANAYTAAAGANYDPVAGAAAIGNTPANAGQTYTLTTGVDNIALTGNNNVVNGTLLGANASGELATGPAATFSGLDSIKGTGTGNTLNLVDSGAASSTVVGPFADSVPTGVTVSGVQTLNLTTVNGVGAVGTAFDVSGFTGLQNFNVAASTGTDVITAAATTAVSVNDTKGAVTVNGGSTVSVTAGTDVTSAVHVNGVAGTTSVAVKGGDAVTITDVDATTGKSVASITSVSLNGGTGGATLTGDAITNVSITNEAGTGNAVSIENSAKGGYALNLTLNGAGETKTSADAQTISDAKHNATSVAITTTGAASDIALDATAAKSLTITGDQALTLAVTGDTVLQTIVGTGAGGVTVELPTALTKLTSVDLSGETGQNVVTADADVGFAITAGSATNDEIVLNFDASTLSNTASNISGFEVLGTGSASTGSFDLSKFAGITSVDVTGASAGALDFQNATAGQSLSIDGSLTNGVTFALQNATGTNDSLSISLGTVKTDGNVDAATNGVTVTGIENVTINSLGTNKTALNDNSISLTDANLTKLVVTGTENIAVSADSTKVATIDATGLGKGVSGDFHSITTATTGLTFTGADGSYYVSGDAAAKKADVFTAGNGDNHIVETGAGNSTITLGDGDNTVDVGSSTGVNTITVGNGANTITLSDALNVVKAGTGNDTFNLSANANVNVYNTITGAHAGDVISFGDALAASYKGSVSLAGTAAFSDFANAAATQAGAHGAASFVYSGNTYVVESVAGTGFSASNDTIVKLTGTVDLTKATIGADHALHLA